MMGHGQHRNSAGPTSFVSSLKVSAKRIASNKSNPQQADSVFESIDEGYPPSFSTKRSSTSSRSSHRGPYKSRTASESNASLASLTQPPDRKLAPSWLGKNHLSNSTSLSARKPVSSERSLDGLFPSAIGASTHADLESSTGSLTMADTAFANGYRTDYGKPPSTSQSNVSFGQGGNNASLPTPGLPPASGGGMQNPSIIYQQLHDVSTKRISTMDYLRKAHEGRVYWYNTLYFTKSDIARMPFFEPKKLARRATNYLLLGLSLPSIFDLNSGNPQEYLRALNALLSEFESYQQIHPPDGSSASSLSRARLPSMFKRTAHQGGSKGRRTSSAADIGLPMSTSDPADLKKMSNVSTTASTMPSFPASEQELLPGEEYTYLVTPSLPFDPDFFETFATLCDVLIDCYTRIMTLVPSPAMCAPLTGELFTKADTKLRKIIVQGIVKEFEDASRAGAKAEFAGLGKVILGGLM